MADPQPDVHDIFNAAIECPSEANRARYLDEACRDTPQIRGRVEALIRAHRDAGNFLGGDRPTVATPPAESHVNTEQPGTTIGRYKLIHEIGRGGMGVVYMAAQSQPVKRNVALKIIKPGMDTRDVVSRFEAERQALALMDHPSIAHVLDGGSTDSGRPYFVMELVDGTPITDFCDASRYSTRQRLELFGQVCQAIQHAHQKGIIHRDIKPSNILVTTADETAVPKVIDFGIAKAVHQPLTDGSLHTHATQIIGTPLYMSPEQAQLGGQDIDTRTDVYSLGVVLYQLLTGTTPFDKERLDRSGLEEVKRIIQEEEPPRPSTRLSTADTALETITETHLCDPQTLTKQLAGELDWIVMKCLEKDPTRRYESASGLAADVQRHLSGDLVEACPPSAAYRFRKLVRRNRVLLTTTAMVALALIVGTGVSLWQALDARKARDLADQRLTAETAARKAADTNLVIANEATAREQAEREKAEENYRLARQVVDKYFVKVSQDTLLNKPGMRPLRMELLELALAYYQDFAKQHSDDPELQAELGKTHYHIGRILEDLGRYDESLGAFDQALAIGRELAKNDSNENVEQTVSLIERLICIARVNSHKGDHDRAIASLGEGESILKKVSELLTPGQRVVEARLLNQRGIVLAKIGDRGEEAPSAFRRGLEIVEEVLAEHPDMSEEDREKYSRFPAAFTNNLAIHERDDQEAIRLYTKSISLEEQLLEGSNSEPSRYGIANSLRNRAYRSRDRGDYENASKSTELAIEYLETLASNNPGVKDYQDLLRSLYQLRQEIERESQGKTIGQNAQRITSIASPHAQASLDAFLKDELAESDQSLRVAWEFVQSAHQQYSSAELDRALECVELAGDALQQIDDWSLDQADYILLQYGHGMVDYVRGCIALSSADSHEQVAEHFRDAVRDFTRGIRVGSLDPDRQADIHFLRARCHEILGEKDAAISDLKEAIRLEPKNLDTRRMLDEVLRQSRPWEERLPNLTEMIDLADEDEKRDRIYRRGQVLLVGCRFEESVADLERALEMEGEISSSRWFYTELITAHFRLGNHERVVELFDQALEPVSTSGTLASIVARIYTQLRADQQAQTLLDKAMEHGVSDPGELFQMIKAYMRLGDTQQSQTAFDRIVERLHHDHNYFRAVGMAHFARGEYEQAMPALDRAVEIAPPDSRSVPLNARSSCLLRMGRSEQALKDAREAIELRPSMEIRFNIVLGKALVGVGDYEAALTGFNQLMANGRAGKVQLNGRAQALEGLQRFDEALADYSAANAKPYSDANISGFVNNWTRRALLLDRLGRYREALADYETIDASTRVAPFRYDVEYEALVQFIWFLLNCPETELRDPGRALALAQRFAEAYPENAEFQNAIAACHYRLGKDSDALKHLQQAEQLESGGADPFLKAMVYWRSRRESEAKKAYALGQTRESGTGQTQRFQAEAEKLLGSNEHNDPESTHNLEETAK